MAKTCEAYLQVDNQLFQDVTSECWGPVGYVHEKLSTRERPSLYIKILPIGGHKRNKSTNCILNVTSEAKDTGVNALSLVVLHLQVGSQKETVQVTTSGKSFWNAVNVSKPAYYDQPVLVGPVASYLDYGASLDLLHIGPPFEGPEEVERFQQSHLFPPKSAISDQNTSANIVVNLANWETKSSLMLLFTAYTVMRADKNCPDGLFDCTKKSGEQRFCINSSLVCDTLPNCGVRELSGPDEDCSGVEWVFLFLSILLFFAIVLLVIFIVSLITNKYHLFYSHINIPMVRILQTDDSTENLVGH